MAVGAEAIVKQIDAVLREARNVRQASVKRAYTGDPEDDPHHYYTTSSDEDVARATTLIYSALKKYSPSGSAHVEQAKALLAQVAPSNDWGRQQLVGMLEALRFEYANGAVQTVEELVHADLFADFLQMARYQLDKGFKDPAAVLAAGVLEQHLRALAVRYKVAVVKENGEAKRAEAINEELAKAGAYPLSTQKEVTAKLGLRNSAAHGEWDKYDAKQVALFIDSVRLFIEKYPA